MKQSTSNFFNQAELAKKQMSETNLSETLRMSGFYPEKGSVTAIICKEHVKTEYMVDNDIKVVFGSQQCESFEKYAKEGVALIVLCDFEKTENIKAARKAFNDAGILAVYLEVEQ